MFLSRLGRSAPNESVAGRVGKANRGAERAVIGRAWKVMSPCQMS